MGNKKILLGATLVFLILVGVVISFGTSNRAVMDYLPPTGGILTGELTLDDGSGHSPNITWVGGSNRAGKIYYYDGLGLLIHSYNNLHLSAQNYIVFDTYTKSSNMYPNKDNFRKLGSYALRWLEIHVINAHVENIVFSNNMKITECGANLCFINPSDETIMELTPHGDLNITGDLNIKGNIHNT